MKVNALVVPSHQPMNCERMAKIIWSRTRSITARLHADPSQERTNDHGRCACAISPTVWLHEEPVFRLGRNKLSPKFQVFFQLPDKPVVEGDPTRLALAVGDEKGPSAKVNVSERQPERLAESQAGAKKD
jgi:hypothetical protein